jgi:hypothetical protein
MEQARESAKQLRIEHPEIDCEYESCGLCGDRIYGDDSQMNTVEFGMIHTNCEPGDDDD